MSGAQPSSRNHSDDHGSLGVGETSESTESNTNGLAPRTTLRDVANGPHLIVCPASLLGQWEAELQRFVDPAHMTISVIHSEAAKWRKEIKRARGGPGPLVRRIWLTTSTVGFVAPDVLC